MRRNKNKRNKFYIVISLLTLLGIVLIFSSQILNLFVDVRSRKISEEMPIVKTVQTKPVKYDFASVREYSLQNSLSKVDTKKVDKMGQIIIPSVGVNIPIVNGTSNEALLLGAGTLKPNQQMGKRNFAVVGHNVHDKKTLFAPVENIEKNAKIYLTDKKQVWQYKVNKITIVNPDKVSVINDQGNKKMVTLVLCTSDSLRRIIVQGDLVKTNKQNVEQQVAQVTKSSTSTYLNVNWLSFAILGAALLVALTAVVVSLVRKN
ncbi:class A sortase [Periweissella cryptocerci]|nr:class A sortase [Periweissella cryptocerci]